MSIVFEHVLSLKNVYTFTKNLAGVGGLNLGNNVNIYFNIQHRFGPSASICIL